MQVAATLSDQALYQQAWRVMHRLPEFIVDRGGQVIWGNASFERVATDGDVLRLQGPCLSFIDRTVHGPFMTFLEGFGGVSGSWVTRAPTLDGYLVFRCTLIEPAGRSPAVACTLYDSRDHDIPLWADFAGLFGLTGSEAQVALRLMEGLSLARTAAQLRITNETAKTHLRRVYAKLAVGSREEFYARLLPFRVV